MATHSLKTWPKYYELHGVGIGGAVLKLFILDDLHPEDCAMLQALYSRSPASVEEHLEKVKRVGSGKFMDQYYVGYGHRSIGDCAMTTLFIEGVTMLAAKAIQDWPLYSGQEASMRYQDFSKVEFANPLDLDEGAVIQDAWRAFYLDAQEDVRAHLRAQHPRQPGEEERVYQRAINARSFDILRAFLPAGALTNLSWTTNLRQAWDHLVWLAHHPDESIADLAYGLLDALAFRYPKSFRVYDPPEGLSRVIGLPADEVDFRTAVMRQHMLDPDELRVREVGRIQVETTIEAEHRRLLVFDRRPRGVELPRRLAELGDIRSEFLLDFGSFCDLQRHRNGVVRMPVLTTQFGFHPWYLDQLPPARREQAQDLIREQIHRIRRIDLHDVQKQPYIAMGFLVGCRVTQSLPAYVYRLELRSSQTVHPTLRQVVLKEIDSFRKLFPHLRLHVDDAPDRWSIRRCTQTIEEKS